MRRGCEKSERDREKEKETERGRYLEDAEMRQGGRQIERGKREIQRDGEKERETEKGRYLEHGRRCRDEKERGGDRKRE